MAIKENTKKGYAEAYEGDSVNLEYPTSKTRRGRVGKQCAQTLTTGCNQGVVVAAAMRGRPNSEGGTTQNIEISDREISNALTTVQKDSLIVITGEKLDPEKEADPELHKVGYIKFPNSDKDHQSNRFYDEEGISPSLDTCSGGNRQGKIITKDLIIRKLTPKECFRLMGFDDEDYQVLADNGISDAQIYKMAGNSIVVNVLEAIFRNLLREEV